MSENPWQRLSSREIYENSWIKVREDQVIRPDGMPGIYGLVQFKNHAIGVVPVTDEVGAVYLAEGLRFGACP